MKVNIVNVVTDDGDYLVHVFATPELAEAWVGDAPDYEIEEAEVLETLPEDRPRVGRRSESDVELRARLNVGVLGDVDHPVSPGEDPDVVSGALRLVQRG